MCKHSLISIDFIASVYELFENPRMWYIQNEFSPVSKVRKFRRKLGKKHTNQ